MPRMCSYNNNIENVVSLNIQNWSHVFLWLNKIMSYYWKTINLVLLGLCHCLKSMPHLFKPLDMDNDVDMAEVKDVVAVKVAINTILLIVVVLKVKITTQTTRSGIIQRYNLKKRIKPQSKHARENKCHKCGMKWHWSRTCRTPKHFVDLYQASIKAKGKKVEMNFIDSDDPIDLTHLDVSDFFENPNGKLTI